MCPNMKVRNFFYIVTQKKHGSSKEDGCIRKLEWQ